MPNFKEKYEKEIKKQLSDEFKYSNVFQIPKIEKVSVNVGAGAAKDSREMVENISGDIALISGQHPRINKSRVSVSGFKLREGQTVGISTTLRSMKMYDFLQRLVSVALPRIRDFRGLSKKSFDNFGNFSLGIREQTIFPEIKFDKVRETFGLQVNIKTTAKTKEEAIKLLELFGFPFEKENK
ncbi:MAG: 50S ribosomal protein L5 [Candidatus Berkelbacteria bacterium]|nr:50S ribosomal protein L5 [Candidatus Berkelbacteria bacterium]